jgi:hypothetical protein
MNVTSVDPTTPGEGDIGVGRRLDPDSSVVERISVEAIDGRTLPGAHRTGSAERRLTPKQPPGRITRKARAYASEILRLHEAGYSLDAIREALADVGVKVSISTVWRETTRPTNEPSAAPVVGAPRA